MVAANLVVPSVGAQPNLAPDLVITGVTVDSTRIGVGEPYDYTVTVKNIGGMPCNRVRVSLVVPPPAELTAAHADAPLTCDRQFCEGDALFLLLPGHSFQARWTMRAGRAGLQPPAVATVDPANVCLESNEGNNTGTSPAIQVIDRPQLRITGHRPRHMVGNWRVDAFTITITNVGSGVATDVAVAFAVPGPNGLQSYRLDPAYFGPFVAPGQPSPPPLPVTCLLPVGIAGDQVCSIPVRLGPGEMVQAVMVNEQCLGSVTRPIVQVSTADDTSTIRHSINLHSTCNMPP